MATVTLKSIAKKWIETYREEKIKPLCDQRKREEKKEGQSFKAAFFAYDATQKVVQKMLHQLQGCLVEDRDALQRAQQAMSQLLTHPDIKIILQSIAASYWQVNPKQLLVIDHILAQLKLAVSLNSHQRDKESRRLYEILMNICSPPPGARLGRATAELLGLRSTQGLRAGGMRVAARRVAAEAGGDAVDSDDDFVSAC